MEGADKFHHALEKKKLLLLRQKLKFPVDSKIIFFKGAGVEVKEIEK